MTTVRERLVTCCGRLADESGLTLVEAVVAALVLTLGAAAVFGVLGSATRNAQRAKATQVMQDLAQEELEKLHNLPYEEVALDAVPATSESSQNPNSRVSGEEFALTRSPVGDYRPLVVSESESTGLSPESSFEKGEGGGDGIKGKVYRYVVWRNDPTCPESECPGEEDYKQVVIAVQPEQGAVRPGESGYVEVQSQLTEPTEGTGGGGAGGGGEEVTAQQFFLSDTPCASSGETERESWTVREETEDHPLHNTLGTCASGRHTGNTLGAPDALLLSDPPDPDPLDPSNPPQYNYSSDLYPAASTATDKGVQINRDNTTGCNYNPAGTTYPASQVHRWVTDPMPFEFEMNGKVTLQFYTRALNDLPYTGELCVYLFERSETEGGSPVATDLLFTAKGEGNAYWTYVPQENGYWPRNAWTKVRLTMELKSAPRFIQEGNRLGVALSVNRANTPEGDPIPVEYDHPDYPTRIEVESSTPIEGE